MRDDTLSALKAWRSSKALKPLDEKKFRSIISEIRSLADDELWSSISAKVSKKRPEDPVLKAIKTALAKYKASAADKAVKLSSFLLPDRSGPVPKTLPVALKILRGYLTDVEIERGAHELMAKIRNEAGTDVPL